MSSSTLNIGQALRELAFLGYVPVLHHTPIRPEYAAEEDADDPEPRWCCHDERNDMHHFHGATPEEAIRDMLLWARKQPK